MDAFARTFLPAAAEAGLSLPTVNRHLPVFQRCVEPDDTTVLVTRVRPASSRRGDFLLLLTHRRLVMTRETRILRRLQLHLNANLRHLSHVAWSTDLRDSSIEMSATAVDGVRERFQMRLGDNEDVMYLEGLLKHVFTESRNVSLAA